MYSEPNIDELFNHPTHNNVGKNVALFLSGIILGVLLTLVFTPLLKSKSNNKYPI